MAEGDTIHRTARRLDAALGGRTIEIAVTPSPRSPIHGRAGELEGRDLERVEARGKHLIASFAGGVALHSHLGIEGRWLVRSGRRAPSAASRKYGPDQAPPERRVFAGVGAGGKPWLVLASGEAVAAQLGGKLLRLVSASRIRNDPMLARLGPDPLAPGFDLNAATARLLRAGGAREVGDVLLDQTVLAGVGNAIRNEACFQARVSPWRAVGELGAAAAERLVVECRAVMEVGYETGRRPRSVYRQANRPCPRCGTPIRSRGQGDANRMAYWCPRCQR